jgi:hypothetical protein
MIEHYLLLAGSGISKALQWGIQRSGDQELSDPSPAGGNLG